MIPNYPYSTVNQSFFLFLDKHWYSKRAPKWGQWPEADPVQHGNNHHPTTGEQLSLSWQPPLLISTFWFSFFLIRLTLNIDIYCFCPQENINSTLKSLRSSVEKIDVSTNTWKCQESTSPSFCGSFLSSPALPGNSGGGAEQRGSSTRLPQHKYDTDHRYRE